MRRRRLAAVVAAITALGVAPTVIDTPGIDAPAQAREAFPVGYVHEQHRIPAAELPGDAGSGTRLLYLTRDQNGEKAMSTGVFWTPKGKAPAGGWPIVSWAHGTTGTADECAPSRTRKGDGLEPPIRRALAAGYAVTATDYAGLGSPGRTEYLGGKSAGHSVIDMIRAARSVDRSLSDRWVSVGHSQGGHAALFAANMAPTYAAELPVKGAVAIAPVSSIERVFSVFGPNTPGLGRFNGVSGPFLYILAGLAVAHEENDTGPDIDGLLTDTGRKYLDVARRKCNGDLASALRDVSPGSLVAKSFTDDVFAKALREYAEVPVNGYRVPVRIQHGLLDPVLPYLLSSSLRSRMRDAGTDVSLKMFPRADHSSVVDDGLDDLMSTIRADFART